MASDQVCNIQNGVKTNSLECMTRYEFIKGNIALVQLNLWQFLAQNFRISTLVMIVTGCRAILGCTLIKVICVQCK
jgi:hypothetical protein